MHMHMRITHTNIHAFKSSRESYLEVNFCIMGWPKFEGGASGSSTSTGACKKKICLYVHALDVNWDTVDSPCDVTAETGLQIQVCLRGTQHTGQTNVIEASSF
jgi:hypothetical protein